MYYFVDYRLLEEVARCVEEAEWKRESLETPQQAVLDIQGDDAEAISSNPAKVAVDTEEAKVPTGVVSEQCIGEIEPSPICEDIAKKPKKQKKKKSKNPVASDQMSKTDILIAKAERIRQQILNSRKIKQTETVHQEEQVGMTKQDNDKSNKCKFQNEDDEKGEIADGNDDVDDHENSSSSSQESSDSNNSSSSSPDESDEIEEVIEDEEDQLPDELPLGATTEEITPDELNDEEEIENGQEMQMNDTISEVEEPKLSKEELLQFKKEKLRASVALGGTRKSMVSCIENFLKQNVIIFCHYMWRFVYF